MRGGTWTCALTHVHSLSTWTLVVVRIVAVARDCRCRQGLSLSPGILVVARDCRCCKGGILRGILAVLTVVGILAIVRVGFSLSEGILAVIGIVAVARDSCCRQGGFSMVLSLSLGIVAVVRVGFSVVLSLFSLS